MKDKIQFAGAIAIFIIIGAFIIVMLTLIAASIGGVLVGGLDTPDTTAAIWSAGIFWAASIVFFSSESYRPVVATMIGVPLGLWLVLKLTFRG